MRVRFLGALALTLALAPALVACSDSGAGTPPAPDAPASSANPALTPGVPWQIVLDGTVHADSGTVVYELDASVGPAGVAAVRDSNPDAYLVCYLSAGTWEQWREDADQFPEAVIGEPLPAWPDERYVDLRELGLLEPLWEARIDDCAQSGFDAVDPDNIDSYMAVTGFDLTRDDALAAFELLASLAHERGLGIAQKNAPGLAADLVTRADFAVVEQCFEQDACWSWQPYLDAGKPVLDVEYPASEPPAAWCGRAKRAGISLLYSAVELAEPGSRCE